MTSGGEHRLTNICPLCNKLRVNDTALSVSGSVVIIINVVCELQCFDAVGWAAGRVSSL